MKSLRILADYSKSFAAIGRSLRNATIVAEGDACDGVVIVAEPAFRASLCRQAAQNGKHILVDMPIAQTSTAAEAVVQTCREAGVRLLVGNAKRFLPSVHAVKDAADSGKLGEPCLLRIHRWDTGSECESLISRLVCEIDLAVWLFGKAPSEVYAVGRTEDCSYAQIHLGFPDAQMALIDSTVLPSALPYYSLSLIGSTGAAYADDHHNMQLLFGEGNPAALTTTQGNVHVVAQIQGFVDAMVAESSPLIRSDDGRLALQIAETAIESLRNHRVAHLTGGCYDFV